MFNGLINILSTAVTIFISKCHGDSECLEVRIDNLTVNGVELKAIPMIKRTGT